MTSKEFFQIFAMLPKLIIGLVLFVLGWQMIGEGIYKLCYGYPHGGRDIVAGLAASAPFSAGLIYLIYALRSDNKKSTDEEG